MEMSRSRDLLRFLALKFPCPQTDGFKREYLDIFQALTKGQTKDDRTKVTIHYIDFSERLFKYGSPLIMNHFKFTSMDDFFDASEKPFGLFQREIEVYGISETKKNRMRCISAHIGGKCGLELLQ